MSIVESLSMSLTGMLVVFAVLVALMLIIILYTKLIAALSRRSAATYTGEEPDSTLVVADKPSTAPSQDSTGNITLWNVDEKTAAVIMAIVSDNTKIPLNELRFKSIKQIESD